MFLIAACVLLAMTGCQVLREHEGPLAYVGDSAITAHIEVALVHDPRVVASEIDVHTYQGTVTLDGIVDSAAMRDAVDRIARTTPGVRAVDNHLKIADDATTSSPPSP